ncbi:MAG: S-layer homology domain-containing protein [Butyricicoccus sp.]|nr:S-layer homology domain-containing protein [Butyricicoccus sp.]
MKRLISFLLSMVLTLGGSPTGVMAAGGGMLNFRAVATYQNGMFTDVAPDAWYNASVAAAYEQGLMAGEGADFFNAAGQITVAQTIVMAARLHKIYSTGSAEFDSGFSMAWYDPYLSYARENGIIFGSPQMDAAATRAQFADILSRALPEEVFDPINDIADNVIPDVKTGDEYAESIYMLYRAGVVTGSNSRGSFYPNSTISRAEAAAIITRMTDRSLRRSFTLEYSGPDLTAKPEMDDSFFENSAILGNSLVEGLRLYSNMKSITYFSDTSVSVVSATQTRTKRLKNGQVGTLVQALCEEPHDRIYIELGINEIGSDVNYFIDIYGKMLDTIIEAQPDAEIYILSVLPVTQKKSNSSTVFNMTRVNMYNEALYQLAADKQCHYMDVCSALQGDDGYLPSGWSGDGVHLHAQYYSVWENCMRTFY